MRITFATNALGMGVNMAGVNNIIRYGAPRSIEDFFWKVVEQVTLVSKPFQVFTGLRVTAL